MARACAELNATLQHDVLSGFAANILNGDLLSIKGGDIDLLGELYRFRKPAEAQEKVLRLVNLWRSREGLPLLSKRNRPAFRRLAK